MSSAEEICNRALRASGTGRRIGWIYEGSDASKVALEVYSQTLRQILRAAHWTFARKRAPLFLLGDATKQNTFVSSFVDQPWLYAYAWPVDAVAGRWMPCSSGQPEVFDPPLMTNLPATTSWGEAPARFLTTTSDQYPVVVGTNPAPNLDEIEGTGPVNRRIILTNVKNAHFVYTYLALDINVWDESFSQAMVSTLASLFAMPLLQDKKMAEQERNAQIALAKSAIDAARTASFNEAGFPQTVDHMPDWMRARTTGLAYWQFGAGAGSGLGSEFLPWGSMSFADGSVF